LHAEADQAAEFIHQIRVAQRRLRSALKVFAPALPSAFTETWPRRLRDDADRFGPARDLDVLRTELLDVIAPEWLIGTVAFRRLVGTVDEERHAAREASERALDAEEQACMILAFSAGLRQLQGSAPAPGLELAEFARERRDTRTATPALPARSSAPTRSVSAMTATRMPGMRWWPFSSRLIASVHAPRRKVVQWVRPSPIATPITHRSCSGPPPSMKKVHRCAAFAGPASSAANPPGRSRGRDGQRGPMGCRFAECRGGSSAGA